MSLDTVNTNTSRMTAQIKTLFQNARAYAVSNGFEDKQFGTIEVVNNWNWWAGFKLSDFLTNVASYMRMGPMLGRERYCPPLAPGVCFTLRGMGSGSATCGGLTQGR